MTLTDPRLIATLRGVDARHYSEIPILLERLEELGLIAPLAYTITPAGRAELARIDKEAGK